MRKPREVKIWVSSEFRKELKRKAIDEGISVLELTERLTKRFKEDVTSGTKKTKFDFKL